MSKNKIDSLEQCLHQIFKPKLNIRSMDKNSGNCYECIYDPINNKKCNGYTPVGFVTYEVKYKGVR